MRLWHIDLLKYLPRQQLLGQHRECCALRGNGWGRSHSTVNYVFRYPYEFLYDYHLSVMNEMKGRGYNPNANWLVFDYRGKHCARLNTAFNRLTSDILRYPEHDSDYLQRCIENLKRKIDIANPGKYDTKEVCHFRDFAFTTSPTR